MSRSNPGAGDRVFCRGPTGVLNVTKGREQLIDHALQELRRFGVISSSKPNLEKVSPHTECDTRSSKRRRTKRRNYAAAEEGQIIVIPLLTYPN